MNRRHPVVTVLIYLAVIVAAFSFSFWRLRVLAAGVSQGEWFPAEDHYERRIDAGPAKPFFSLVTNRTYGTNERPRVWVNYHDVNALDFRVYRVEDPSKFFKQLANPHRMGADEEYDFYAYYKKRHPTLLEQVHAFKRGFYNWFRDYFRTQLRHDTRKGFNQKYRRADEADEAAAVRTPLNVADYARVPLLNPGQMVSSWREQMPPLKDAYDRRAISLGKREPGVYVVEAVNGDLRAYGIALVTDLAMVRKTAADGQLLVYAVNRQSGAPRANVRVEVVKGKDTVLTGATDNQGLLKAKVDQQQAGAKSGDEAADAGDEEATDEEAAGASQSYLIMANERDQFAISDLDAYYFGGDEANGESLTSYIYTDRPVYRPNQKVYFKGILRHLNEQGYKLLASGGAISVSVEDPNNAKIFTGELKLSSRGTFSGEVNLDEDAPLGSYNVSVTTPDGGTASSYFEVQEYKKPEYKVTVTTEQKFVSVGAQAQFNVAARYFFGAPVTHAHVKYNVYRKRYYSYFAAADVDPIDDFGVEEDDNSDSSDSYYGNESDPMVLEGEGELDAQGNFVVNFTVPQATAKQRWDYTYRLEAQVTDAARREMQGSAEFVGTRGSVVADANPERYVYYQGDQAKVLVKTNDYEGHPVAANVTLTFVEQTWEKIETNDYGELSYDYQMKERDLSSASVRTNAQGEASYDYKVERPGNIALRITVNEGGKQIASVGGSIWVADRENQFSDYSYQGETGIKLVPDKKSYRAGETAHVLALLPTDKAHLLVTTERQSVLTTRTLDTAGRGVVIDVPVEARFAPNVFLSVSYVKNGELYTGEEALVVPPRDKLLRLDIIPNKPEYKPRETVSYTVLARNADGSPAAGAEVSLGVVDEAIYSLQPETAPDIRREFYGRRYNQVQTSLAINYTFTGYAGTKPIRLAQHRRAYQLADFKNDGEFAQAVVRKLFKDTALWQPAIVTGADGKATVKVELPDNLTTWRATARAVTTDTRVGWTTSKVLARKDVIMRVAAPRFLTAGDTATISGVVHNYLDADKRTRISLEVQGAQLLDPPSMDVTIPKNGEYRANWRVSAAQSGQLTFLAKALTDTESDAVEIPLEIVPRGLRQTIGQNTAVAGDGDGEQTVTLNLPANADSRARNLRVEVAPSIAATLFGALDYLTGYPYGCTEQTMSQFLPTVVVANTLRDVQSASISDRNDIGRKVKRGLDRLAKFQHADGGWGWWKDDQTDPWMTAYVVDGLTMASRAGYQTDDQRVQKGHDKLAALLQTGKADDGADINTETRAYLVYAASASGGVDARHVEDLFTNRGRLQPYGRALLALTFRQRGDEARARAVAMEIARSAKVTDFDARWESKITTSHEYTEDDSVEATALSLKALALIDPHNELLPKAARWLVGNRRNGQYWRSTKETAFAIFGLTDYLKVSQELSPDYQLEVYVNNEQVLAKQVTGAAAAGAQAFVIKRKNEEVGGTNQVRVVKRGRGVAYVSATLQYATTDEQVAAQTTNNGLRLTREYLRLSVDNSGDAPKWKTEPLNGELRSGDTIVARLHLEGAPGQYLMLEDPIPAGCEQVENISGIDLNHTDRDWSDYYSAREFRDNRTVLFLYLFDGKATFQYALRVQEPGDFRIAPARAELMYQPNVQANTASGKLTILDRQ